MKKNENEAIKELMEFAALDLSDLSEDGVATRMQICAQPDNSGNSSFMFYQPDKTDPRELTILEYVPDKKRGSRVSQVFLLGDAYLELCDFLRTKEGE